MTYGDDYDSHAQSAPDLTDFKDVGQVLMRRRMELGLSIDDVMARTKLGRRTLELLEQGDLQELPHPVYIKGFIKAYIAVLNVDMDDLLPGLDGVLDASAPAEAPVRVKPVRSLQNVQPYSVPLPSAKRVKSIIMVLLLLMLALGGLIWYSVSEEEPAMDNASLLPRAENSTLAPGNVDVPAAGVVNDPNQPDVAESAEEALKAQNAGVQEAFTTDSPRPGSAANQSAAGNATPAAAPATNASGPLAMVNATNALGETGSEKPSVELKSPAGTGKTLVVKAKEQCWVGLTLDMETAKDFYLYPNQHAVIRFHDTVTLRLGNAGGVSFVYNGKEFPTSFEKGVVKTLTFPPGN